MIPFVKMCASGNDFVVINNMEMGIHIDSSKPPEGFCPLRRFYSCNAIPTSLKGRNLREGYAVVIAQVEFLIMVGNYSGR